MGNYYYCKCKKKHPNIDLDNDTDIDNQLKNGTNYSKDILKGEINDNEEGKENNVINQIATNPYSENNIDAILDVKNDIKEKNEFEIEKEKEIIAKNEKDLSDKENIQYLNISKKENINNEKEDEIKENEKEKNLNLKENNINNRENQLNEKENKLILKENDINQREYFNKNKENELNLKEDELKLKEKELNQKFSELEKEKEPIIIGLNNIGATCYMNATLQCLSNTDELTKYFLNRYKYEPNNNNKIMANEFYIVIRNLWDINNNKKSFSPDDFKEKLSQENPLFAGIAANDSKDLINFLLERLHSELNVINNGNNIQMDNYSENDQLDEQKMLALFTNEFKTNYNSIISNLFYGLLETRSQCQGCKMIKYNFQIYSFVEFPLERVNQYCFNTGKRNNYINNNINKNPDINLYECFEYYGNMELMTGDNQMYCNICKCLCDSLYGTSLYSAPNYLIINLNRGKGAVYECDVIFPEQLNLFNFVSFKNGNTVFELYAVICHIGPSSMSGHFVAYCKHKKDKNWYLYNDAMVSLCENNNAYKKGMPYILFYKVLQS